jgi:hypothetical protein
MHYHVFVGMSGGYLPDSCETYDTEEGALIALAENVKQTLDAYEDAEAIPHNHWFVELQFSDNRLSHYVSIDRCRNHLCADLSY